MRARYRAPERVRCPGRIRAAARRALRGGGASCALALLLLVAPAAAGQAGQHAQETRPAAADAGEARLPSTTVTTTRHAVEADGGSLAYTATAGAVDIALDEARARGRIFYVAYHLEKADADRRALTFVFNGGPGAASAYLHLLALGPRIAALGADGTVPPPPVRLRNNPLTWLAFTDLVFVDPIGTGYSRAVPPEPATEASGKKGQDAGTRFWSFEEDLDSLAEFIRLYLTRTGRWSSPKFLAGESYGGFRAAALPDHLASTPGVRLNGVVLISPVLEFSLQQPDAYRVLPWAVTLPVYAATALHHGKAAGPADDAGAASGRLAAWLAQAEAFAMDGYLRWLARGEDATKAETKAVHDTLVRMLGVPRWLVERHRGRLPRGVFAKALLRDSHRLVSLYDGTVTGIDPHPSSPVPRGGDLLLEKLTASLTSVFSRYVREELRFVTDLPYLVLNRDVHRNWAWSSGHRRRQGFAGTAESLKNAMSRNDDLQVWIVHGYYDLVTSYLATDHVVRQMALDPLVRSNLSLEGYEGGHMPYTHPGARQALYDDAQAFYRRAMSGPK